MAVINSEDVDPGKHFIIYNGATFSNIDRKCGVFLFCFLFYLVFLVNRRSKGSIHLGMSVRI